MYTHIKFFCKSTNAFIIHGLEFCHAFRQFVHHDLSVTTRVAFKDSIMEEDVLTLRGGERGGREEREGGREGGQWRGGG